LKGSCIARTDANPVAVIDSRANASNSLPAAGFLASRMMDGPRGAGVARNVDCCRDQHNMAPGTA